jgi:hypothetical protein
MVIESVVFKRTKKSPWEAGIIINGDALIVDVKGKPVKETPYNYERTHRLTVHTDDTVSKMKGDDNG